MVNKQENLLKNLKFAFVFSHPVSDLSSKETNQYVAMQQRLLLLSFSPNIHEISTNIHEILCLSSFWIFLGIVRLPTITVRAVYHVAPGN